jgi:hypothetical protein
MLVYKIKTIPSKDTDLNQKKVMVKSRLLSLGKLFHQHY